jgi:hypothetical protein
MARERLEPHLHSILESTRAIAFLGTPHHGAGLARWAEMLSRYVGLIKQTNTKLLEALRRESEVFARIQGSFNTLARSKAAMGQPMEITCFYEELPVVSLGLVVPQHSAILLGYNPPIGIHRNHMDLTKFFSAEDPGFVTVCRELGRWVRAISREGAAR